MIRKPSVSIIICTKNRVDDLRLCLTSIDRCGANPKELIVVDNASTDMTPVVIDTFRKRVPYPVRRVIEKRSGYPVIYNRGLTATTSEWAVFVDDDCVVSHDWFRAVSYAIRRYRDSAVIVGDAVTRYNHNVFSLATSFHQWYWKLGAIRNNRIIDYEILDNKNIAYNMRFLKKHHIRFDETRMETHAGAAEDCDLGMQIYRAHGIAQFASRIIVSHKDPTTWGTYIRKTLRSYRAYTSFADSWRGYRTTHIKRLSRQKSIRAIFRFMEKQQLSFSERLCLFIVVEMTYLIKKIDNILHT